MALRLRLILIGLLAGCSPSGSVSQPGTETGDDDGVIPDPDPGDPPHTLTAIVVTPINPLVELDLDTTEALTFTATGRYTDGVDEDLTSRATWTVAHSAVGTFTAATLNIPAFAEVTAKVSRIRASFQDLEGEAQVTVVAYRRSGAQQSALLVLPFDDAAEPDRASLEFSTKIPSLDVFFLVDTTGSMLGEISNLQNALTSTVVPGIRDEVADSQFGVGAFEDFPIDPYGSTPASSDCPGAESVNDQPFELKRAITSDVPSVQAGVGSLRTASAPIGCGNDWPESGIEALYQVATGEGLSSPSPTLVPANHTGVGGVGYRSGAMPVIVSITDAVTHATGETDPCSEDGASNDYAGAVATAAHSRTQTKTALNTICARAVGVASIPSNLGAACTGQAYLEDFARSTDARVPPQAWDGSSRPAGCASAQCCTDMNGAGRAPDNDDLCPLVFRTNDQGTGLGNHIVTGIAMLTRFATFDVAHEREGVAADIHGAPLPISHTTADFIERVVPTGFETPSPPPAVPDPTYDATTFHAVTPGTKVSFDVEAFNDFVPQTDEAYLFRAVVRVLADGCTPLDERDVLFLVPPTPLAPK